jgi:hypothetical protein
LPRPAKTKETQKLRYFSLGELLRLLCFKDLGGNNNSVSSGRMAFLQGKGNIINSADVLPSRDWAGGSKCMGMLWVLPAKTQLWVPTLVPDGGIRNGEEV